jgi:hypothetical protein
MEFDDEVKHSEHFKDSANNVIIDNQCYRISSRFAPG